MIAQNQVCHYGKYITGNLIFHDQLWQSRTSYSAAIFGPGLLMAAIIGPPGPRIARTSYHVTVLITQKKNMPIRTLFPYRSHMYIGASIYI